MIIIPGGLRHQEGARVAIFQASGQVLHPKGVHEGQHPEAVGGGGIYLPVDHRDRPVSKGEEKRGPEGEEAGGGAAVPGEGGQDLGRQEPDAEGYPEPGEDAERRAAV